jgi:hypothetical protein
MVNDAEVARLLALSREAHKRKKHAAGTVNARGDVASQPNYPLAEQHMAEALRLRLEAHALDPDHTAPAWSVDAAANKGISHAQLVSFMRRYAEIP